MVISNKYGFIYLQTKKTGSVSLSLALGQIADPSQDIIYKFAQHNNLQKSLGIKANAWKRPKEKNRIKYKVNAHANWKQLFRFINNNEDYFKFTVERNPWDKVVSLYHYFLNSGFNKKRQYLVKSHGFNGFIKNTRLWKICYNWPLYTDSQDKVKLDYICMYENLDKDLEYIEYQIGVKFVHLMERKANANFRRNVDYRNFYTKETGDIVERFYKKEIEYFGYEY